jgi:hypothetical protein
VTVAVLVGGFGVVDEGAFEHERKEEHLSPTLKVQWDINPDLMGDEIGLKSRRGIGTSRM